MTPINELPPLDALDALTSVVNRRVEESRVLKEQQKSRLTCKDYRQMRTDLNKHQFILPLDLENIKASIYYIRQKFIRFCDELEWGQWRTALQPQNCDKGMMMSFLYWICETYLANRRKKGKTKSVNQYWRDFKMLFRRANGERVDANDSVCDFSTELDMKEIIDRKTCAINLFVALASKQETQKQRPSKACEAELKEESPSPESSPAPVEIPLICEKTQCIFCIGNEKYSYEKRLRTFRRVSHMMDHVEDVQLRYLAPDEKIICQHPMCQSEIEPFDNVNHFKNHVARVHKIILREPIYVK